MEERKFATVLFADFVESTALGGQHDPEVVRATFGATFARMKDILVAHGGTVEKFIGDAVMAVFGVPKAHEDDALRAVRAAFALRDQIVRGDATSPIRIALRVGVNTGEVVAGAGDRRDFLVTGQPVNLGARLQSSAEPGQILVGTLTRDLTAASVRYGESIAVTAKGLGVVPAWPALELLSEPIAGNVRTTEIVDREDEMRILVSALERVRGERAPVLVTVHGNAGVGKSRLVAEFTARAGDVRVRRGRCVPYGDAITFAPLQSILRADSEIAPDDPLPDAVQKLRATLQSAFSDAVEAERVAARLRVLAGLATVRDALAEIPQESLAQELDWALRRYVEQRSADRPMVLVFEDVHWAEPALLDTIEHLAEWANASLLLVCLARPEFVAEGQGWGTERASSISLPMRPLSETDTIDLVTSLLPKQHEGSRDDVARRSEGNPLYAEELVRHIIESGGRATEVPATLQGLIAARLDAADAPVKTLLQRASVIGRVFWTDALGELGEDRARMRGRLLDASRRDFIVAMPVRGPGGGWEYRFAHALTRDVAYASLAKAERASLHDRFGRWLESVATTRSSEDLETIAFHAERAYAYATEISLAGAAALGQRAFDLLVAAGRAAHERADYRRSGDLFGSAITVGRAISADPAQLIEPQGRVAILRLRLESSEDAVAEVQRVLEMARRYGPTPTLASLLQWSAMYAPYAGVVDARDLHHEAVEVARAIGDQRLLASVLRGAARVPASRGDLAEEREILRQARELLPADDRVVLPRVLLDLANNAIATGDFTSARSHLDGATPLATDVVGRVMANRAEGEFGRAIGDLGRARTSGELALAAARELGSPSAIADAAVLLGSALREIGDADRSRGVLTEALATVRGRAPDAMLVSVRLQLARADLALGAAEDARAHVDDALSSPLADIAISAELRSTEALVAAAAGLYERALALFAEGEDMLRDTGLALELATVRIDCARTLLSAGRHAEAERYLASARAFYADPLGAPRVSEIDALRRGAPVDRSAPRAH